MDTDLPFKDLVVVELASVLAGPAVGMFFAELGAQVIKIENKNTGGDVTRSWKLPVEDQSSQYSAYYHSINWGKEKQLLDLRSPSEYEEVVGLIKKADIVISNFKNDSAINLKLDYATLKDIHPTIIYGAITAYGDDSNEPGFDVMMQAETGWIHMTGEKGGAPVKLPVALVDILAAHQLKEGILIALLNRERNGKGSYVSISLFDASIAALANQASNWLNIQVLPERKGSQHPNIAPYGDIFYTKDLRGVILGTGTQKQYLSLCDCLNLSFLKTDERFTTNALRIANRTELVNHLKVGIGSMNYDDLMSLCKANKVTIAPINDLKQVFSMPKAKNLILKEVLPNGQETKTVKTAVFKIRSN